MLRHAYHSLMDRPIPDLSDLRFGKSACRKHLLCPIHEKCVRVNGELLSHSYYWHYDPRPEGAMEDIFLRERVVLKLKKIDQILRTLGLRLLIQEGFRPLPVQRFVQEVSVLNGLRKEYPNLGKAELEEKVKMFAASMNGDLQSSPTPHFTGGAADLTIVYASGEQVDMGKGGGLYNTAFPDALEKIDHGDFEHARRFRRLLFWLALWQEMIVNPTEWWHISYGDQMWAWATKAPYAIYGVAEHFE